MKFESYQISKIMHPIDHTSDFNDWPRPFTNSGLIYGCAQTRVQSKQIQDFNNTYPVGEGILKGVNFLDAGFHVGVNTIGQSLRNANLNLRAEPPNPQVKVSPWMNSTIAPDLSRKSLDDETVCNARPSSGTLNGFDGNGSLPASSA